MQTKITTPKATGLCRIILLTWRWLRERRGLPTYRYHAIFNPFKSEEQSLEGIMTLRLWRHENRHRKQCEYYGPVRFIILIVIGLLVCGYEKSPLEVDARRAENG